LEEFVFLLSPQISKRLKEHLPSQIPVNISEFTFEEIRRFESARGPLQRSMAEWKVLNNFISKRDINEILFMIMDRYLYVIGSKKLKRININISGILFNPYPQIPVGGEGFLRGVEKIIRRFKKKIVFHWMMKNKNIKKIFVLNDPWAAKFFEKKYDNWKKIFCDLPDPIPEKNGNITKDYDLINKYQIDPKSIKLLVFGRIDSRKNIRIILDSILIISYKKNEKFSFFIFGKCNNDVLENDLRYKIRQIEKECEKVEVIFENKFMSEREKNKIFREVDIVLAIYSNFYSSSGVLGHAVKSSKPVITSKFGLMNFLIKRYELGEVADPNSAQSIADAIEKVMNSGARYEKSREKFLKQRRPVKFAEKLLSSI
jgi:glycosyltransferase involved in cell wall biosynthesis